MNRAELELKGSDIDAELMPRLREKVFHVTCRANLPAIERAGEIGENSGGLFRSAFGSSENSFFRQRGCVSVFDYRTPSDLEIQESLRKCSPHTAARRCEWELAIFVLKSDVLPVLLSWREWQVTQQWAEMVVPHVEAGHPGPIPLSSVEEILEVRIEYVPSPFEAAFEQLRAIGRTGEHGAGADG